MTDERVIKAICDAVILGTDADDNPMHLEPREARQAIAAYHAALAARPVQEPVAWIEREVLKEIAKHWSATGTVCSPLFRHEGRAVFDKVALYAAPQPAHGTSATERVRPVNLEGSLPKLPPYSQSAFPHGFHELWTERQMRKFARDTAAFWINDFLEKAAQIVERYGADPWIARDIRALAALEGSSGHTAQSPKSEIDEAGNTGWMIP